MLTLTQDLNHPIVVVVQDFNLDSKPDIAALNADGTVKIFLNTSTQTQVQFDETLPASVGAASVAMASADFNGDFLPDLVIVNTDKTVQVVLNTSTVLGNTITFAAPQTVFQVDGTPVGVATGTLHGGGSTLPDIAVLYGRSSDNEAMVPS